MPRVNIPGVGAVNFPDDMSPADIQNAIETEILPQAQGTKERAPAPDMSESLGDKASSLVRKNTKVAGTGAEAVLEGVMRNIEGTGELVSSVAQAPFSAYDSLRGPNLSELVTGKQKSANILGDYQDAVDSRRAGQRDKFESTYGRDSYPETLSKVSELGFGMLTGATEMKAVKTLWQAVKAGAKVGAVTGASQYTGAREVSDKVQSSLVGSALGGIAGTVPGAATAGKNAIRRYLTADPVPEAAQAAAKVQGAFPSLQGELTIGQQTGNVRAVGTEAKVAQRIAQEQWLRQQTKLVTELEDLAKRYGPDLGPEEIVKRGGQAIANASSKLRQTRKAIWNADLAAIRTKLAADAGGGDGGKVLVELPELSQKFSAVLDDFGQDATNLHPRLKQIMESHAANGGSIPFDDVDFLLQRLNNKNFPILSDSSKNPEAVAAIAGRLKSAVGESLDEIAESSEVGALLAEARGTYSKQSAMIGELNTSAAAKALGVDKKGYAKLVENPEAAMAKLLELTPSQQRQTLGMLKVADPELVSALRGQNLRSALQEATSVTAAGTPNLDIQKLLKATVGGGTLRAKGLYSPADGDILEGNLKALNVLLNRAGYKAPVTEATEAGMSAVGLAAGNGSLPFVTRIVGKILGGFGAEKVLFDPKARQEFLTIANTWGTKSSAGSAAAGRLGAMLDGSYNNEEE